MKIRFLKTVGEIKNTFRKGKVYDFLRSEGQYYIDVGCAEKVKEENSTESVPIKKPIRPLKKKKR